MTAQNTSLSLFNSEANVIPKRLQVRVQMLQKLRNGRDAAQAKGRQVRGGPSAGQGPARTMRGPRREHAGTASGTRGRGDGAEGRRLSRPTGYKATLVTARRSPPDARPPPLAMCRRAITCSGPGAVLAEAAATQKTPRKKQPRGNRHPHPGVNARPGRAAEWPGTKSAHGVKD